MAEVTNHGPDLVVLGDVRADGAPDVSSTRFSFPVPHGEMRVRQAVRLDQIEIPGRSGKVKQATGYEDAEVEVRLTLADEEDRSGSVTRTAVDQLRELQSAFRDRRESDALPRVFSIRSRLTDACDIRTVLFVGIEASESPGVNDLDVTVSFVEYEPVARQVERQSAAQAVAAKAATEAASATGTELGAEDPLGEAFRAGRALALGGGFEGERPGEDPEAGATPQGGE